MPFYCDLCQKEMPEECGDWETFVFGFICGDHDHIEIAKVVELTSAKVRENLINELTLKFRNQVIEVLDSEQ